MPYPDLYDEPPRSRRLPRWIKGRPRDVCYSQFLVLEARQGPFGIFRKIFLRWIR